jgi:hypothetical protein
LEHIAIVSMFVPGTRLGECGQWATGALSGKTHLNALKGAIWRGLQINALNSSIVGSTWNHDAKESSLRKAAMQARPEIDGTQTDPRAWAVWFNRSRLTRLEPKP